MLVAVWNTTLQTKIPKESLGRVTAWDWMSSLALWPVGLAVAGPLAQAFGVTTMCWVTGILGLAASSGCASSRTCGGCGRRRCWPAPPALRRRRPPSAARLTASPPSSADVASGPLSGAYCVRSARRRTAEMSSTIPAAKNDGRPSPSTRRTRFCAMA